MARSLDNSLRDCTGKVLPIVFLFTLTAYITTTLVYSNGHNLPVPGHVSAGLLSTLASLVLFYTLGRLYCYFKGPPSHVLDEERPTSRESKMHATMAPPPSAANMDMQKDRFAAPHQPAVREGQHPRAPLARDAAIFPTPDLSNLPHQTRPFRPFRPAAVQVQPVAQPQRRISPKSNSTPSPITPSRIPRPLRTGLARLHDHNGHSRQASADFTVAGNAVTQSTIPSGREQFQPPRGMRGGFLEGTGHGNLPPSAPNPDHLPMVNVVELSGVHLMWPVLLRRALVSDCCKEPLCVQLLEKEMHLNDCLVLGDGVTVDAIGSVDNRPDTEWGTLSRSTTDSVSTAEISEEEYFGREDWDSPA